jgi:phage anti-repressor protein
MSSLLYPQGNGFLRVYSDSKQTFATVCILPKEVTEILEYPERAPDDKIVTRREVIVVDYKPSTAASHTVRLPTSKQTFDVWFKLENISLLPDADYQIQISKEGISEMKASIGDIDLTFWMATEGNMMAVDEKRNAAKRALVEEKRAKFEAALKEVA